MSNLLFKDLAPGAIIYALIKGDDLLYKEGTVANVGIPRMEMPQGNNIPMGMPRNVVDVTFTVDGKSFTEAISITDSIHSAKNMGGVAMLSTDKDAVVRELRASLKIDEDYLAGVDQEKKKREKRVKQCRDLIAALDTEFAAKQAADERVQRLEDNINEIKAMLAQLTKK